MFFKAGVLRTEAAGEKEEFIIQVTLKDGDLTFNVPTSGYLGENWTKSYSWNIDWGDGQQGSYTQADSPNGQKAKGIPHTYAAPGVYNIKITPAGSTDAWLGAFGFYAFTDGANNTRNKEKVTALLSPLTQKMTRTAAQISAGTGTYWEWAYTFYGCVNITMGDSFNLPQDITSTPAYYGNSMFKGCSGDNFTMNKIFNLPQNVTNPGYHFAGSMFEDCSGKNFNMNDVFNLPQNLQTMPNVFAVSLFSGCSGNSFTMNKVFNLPTKR